MASADVLRLSNEINVRGWTQRDLAVASGLSEGLISRIFSGYSARPSSLQRIARALETRPVDAGLQMLIDSTLKIQDPTTSPSVVRSEEEPQRVRYAQLVVSPAG